MGFEAVVFDLDGTLIDSVPDVANAVNVMLAKRGRRTLSADEVRLMVGEGARVMLERAFAATGGPANDVEDAMRDYLAAYSARPVADTVPYPGVVAALERLTARGVKLGVCTNKNEAVTRLVLDSLGLSRLLTAVTGGDTFPYCKPDGRHVTGTLERMGVRGRAAYVGDSETDMAAARDARLPVIAVAFGYSKGGVENLGADRVIGHYDDLDSALAGLADAECRPQPVT
ncbi:MAG: HAD-IA family hydrolase [Magnetospirillum sp.]|nr:HAD-IA family hydrolase [Magnetospirillum sp.]